MLFSWTPQQTCKHQYKPRFTGKVYPGWGWTHTQVYRHITVSKPEFPHFVWFRKSHDIPVYASIYIYMWIIYQQIQARNQKPKEPEAKKQKPEAKKQKPETKKMPKKNNLPLYIYIEYIYKYTRRIWYDMKCKINILIFHDIPTKHPQCVCVYI